MEKTWLEVNADEKNLDEKIEKVIAAREALHEAVNDLQRATGDCLKVTIKSDTE